MDASLFFHVARCGSVVWMLRILQDKNDNSNKFRGQPKLSEHKFCTHTK